MIKNKNIALLILIIGVIGLTATTYLIINSYLKAKNIGALLKPVAIGFIPFLISFAFFKIGIARFIKKNS